MEVNKDVSADTAVFTLVPGDVNHLFRRSGLKGNNLSIFRYNGEQAAVSSASEGFKAVAESPVFHKIARDLLEPDIKISFRRVENFAAIQQYYVFFSSKDSSVLMQFTNSQGEIILMLFNDEKAFWKWWTGVYASEGMDNYKSIFPDILDIEVLVCILHSLDVYKRYYMESMFAYRNMGEVSISTTDFVKLLKQSLASSDIRWSLPSLFKVVPGLRRGKLSLKQEHIKKLEELGFVTGDGKLILTMADKGKAMGNEFLTSWIRSIGLEVSSLVNGQEKTLSQMFMASTAFTNHMVILEAVDGMNYRFRHEALKRDAVASTLQKWIKTLYQHSSEDSVLPPVNNDRKSKYCGHCGSKLYPGKKFCTNCGAKL